MAVKRKTDKQVYIANESFVAQENGMDVSFHQGRTRRYEDDEIVKRAPHLFDPLEDHDGES